VTGFVEDIAFKLAGLDDADIATINTRIPDIQNLIHILQTHTDQVKRVVDDLGPIIQKVLAKQRSAS
jgi:hypothetical protein